VGQSNHEYSVACSCERCIGIRKYPEALMCDWCHAVHRGDANNCGMESTQPTTVTPAGPVEDSPEIDRLLEKICATVISKIRLVRDSIEEYNMLPSSSGSTTNRPQRAGQRGGMNYLKNEMLSTTPKDAKILAVKADSENQFGPRVICKLALNGEVVFWGVNIKKNPNYTILEKKFGLDENDWAGEKILLSLEKDDFTENYQIRVSFPAQSGARK
jgi:hypothetical protein